MGDKEFLVYLDELLENRYRYWHLWEQGEIAEFCVQYEALIDRQWHPVVRYDSAHGEPHKDVLHPDGTETKEMCAGFNYAEVLTDGQKDIIANWPRYRAKYERERRR